MSTSARSVSRGTGLALVLAAAFVLVTGCAPGDQQGQPKPAGESAADRARKLPRVSPLPTPEPSASPSAPAPDVLAALPAETAPLQVPSSAVAYAVRATGPSVAVHAGPEGRRTSTMRNPVPSGAPLTFLFVSRQGPWLEVLLPVEPNGSKGWVREQEVVVEAVPYRLDVRTADHEMDLYESGALVRSFSVGIGKSGTPTPGGTFYLKELLQPPNPRGSYGPYAYGLSGFSQTLESFAGTDPVIGIHGTDDPSSIGRDVSAGCIRMRNSEITELAKLLPLGTPVRILA